MTNVEDLSESHANSRRQPRGRERVAGFWGRHSSPLLMWLFLAVTLASPLADWYPRAGAALTLLMLISLLIGASLWGNKKVILQIGIPLCCLWAVARTVEELLGGPHLYEHLGHFAGLALSAVALWAVFDRLASRTETRGSVIAEAFIGYLIVANAFSQVYWIFYKLIPNSFASVAGSAQSSTFLYFSLSTLSALGAGDILPLNPFVRLLSALESITGIFFIAVVVARLVSAYRTAVEVDVAGRNAAP